MANSRIIKPGFFTNEVLAECEPFARLLFAGLWTLADRDGRLEDRPRRIKTAILPYDDCDMNGLLQELHEHGFILRYEVDGQPLIQVSKFLDHQRIHPNEKSNEFPAPPGESTEFQGIPGNEMTKCLPIPLPLPVPLPVPAPAPTPAPSAAAGTNPANDSSPNSQDSPEAVVEAWNRQAKTSGWCACASLTRARRQTCRERLKDGFWASHWQEALAKAGGLHWLGDNPRGWKADIDWFLKPGTVPGILEGKYSDRKEDQHGNHNKRRWAQKFKP
jgi:hypothetical protein